VRSSLEGRCIKKEEHVRQHRWITLCRLLPLICLLVDPTRSISGQASSSIQNDASLPIEKRVAGLVSRMTLEEKISR